MLKLSHLGSENTLRSLKDSNETFTVTADGKTIVEGRMERTIPIQFSLDEDVGSPVDFARSSSPARSRR